jgi:hypothetical protein
MYQDFLGLSDPSSTRCNYRYAWIVCTILNALVGAGFAKPQSITVNERTPRSDRVLQPCTPRRAPDTGGISMFCDPDHVTPTMYREHVQ